VRAFCDGPKVVLKARHPSSTLARPVKPKKILVVDDSDLMQRLYGVMLRGGGLVGARDGEEALAKIVADPEIDLVLLDINMPKMNGFEVLRELGARGLVPALRVIVVTTEGRDEDAQRGLAAGAAAYLTKPFRADEVRAAIEALPEPS
jgi:CheY-like chemotaxis protein